MKSKEDSESRSIFGRFREFEILSLAQTPTIIPMSPFFASDWVWESEAKQVTLKAIHPGAAGRAAGRPGGGG